MSLVLLGSVVRTKKKYYPQTLLEECKYEIKKTKMVNQKINDELETSLSDESDSESGSESDIESNNE